MDVNQWELCASTTHRQKETQAWRDECCPPCPRTHRGQEGQHCPSLSATNGGWVPSCPSGKLWRYICVQLLPRRWSQSQGLGLLGLCSTSSHLPGPAALLGTGASPNPWVPRGRAPPLPACLSVLWARLEHLLALHSPLPSPSPLPPPFPVCSMQGKY